MSALHAKGRAWVLLSFVAGAAFAQAPEDEWTPYAPVPQQAPEPAPVVPPPPPAQFALPDFNRPSQPVTARAEVVNRVQPVVERNDITGFGANALGHGRRMQSVTLGFPLIDVKALFGIGNRVDLGIGYDTYYFLMHQPKAVLRVNFIDTGTVAFGAQFEGGYAFFLQRAPMEIRGSRYLSGRRNVNLQPSLNLSIQGKLPRSPRIFFNLHYLLTLDFEGYATGPLSGLPPPVIVGHNAGVMGGAELPLSRYTSFMFALGLDVHGRDVDARVMPMVALGLVTSF